MCLFFTGYYCIMKNVYYDSYRPTTLKQPYGYSSPYAMTIKTFSEDDIVPLHYEECFEIILCDGLEGVLSIEEKEYHLEGKQAFVVLPNAFHSNHIHACAGLEYVLKVPLELFSSLLDLPVLCQQSGLKLFEINPTCPDFDDLKAAMTEILENDDHSLLSMAGLLHVFSVLLRHTQPKIIPESYTTSLNQSSLREIIRWTEENFSKPIQLSMVANKLGYSKYYFCSRFKALTGTTYIRYLNTVRISHAYKLLNAGASVTEAGIACGFSDIGYFIQMFKKVYGVTPKKYVRDRIGTSCKNHIENGPDERINR